MTTIIGLKLINRLDVAIEFQRIISHFGCAIRTRLGLHQVKERFCSSDGIILLEIIDDSVVQELENELLKIDKIEVQHMVFS